MALTAIGQAEDFGVPFAWISRTARSSNPGMDDLFSASEAMRRCTSCGATKPLSEFHRHSQNGGVRPRCRTCRKAEWDAQDHSAYHKAYYAKNRERMRESQRKWLSANPDKKRASDKAWAAANPDRIRNRMLLNRYGITLEQWHEMFEKQGKACLICRSPEPGNKRGWHTDHGVTVRGILCHHCNTGIGMFNHDIRRLKAAIRYLAK